MGKGPTEKELEARERREADLEIHRANKRAADPKEAKKQKR